jgi:hypothetical protein
MAGVNDGKPFRFDQVADLGITPEQLRRMLREGEVRRVLHRVYVDGESVDDRDLRVASLRLVLPKGGVVCLDSAAWVLGVDTFAPSDRMNLVPCAIGTARDGTSAGQGRPLHRGLPPARRHDARIGRTDHDAVAYGV